MPIAGQTEILVNSNLTGNQQFSSMTTLLDGSIVLSWTDYSGAGADQTGSSIHSQRFDASGVAIGFETQVNISSDGDQNSSSVTALADGGYVVAWQTLTDSVGFSYALRTFSADGAPTSGEIAIPGIDGYRGTRPYATQLANGDILVSFTANGIAASYSDTVIAHVSDYASTPTVTTQIVTPSFPSSVQANNSVTALANGGYVVAYQSISDTGYALQFNIFDIEGTEVASSAAPLDTTPTLSTFSDMRPVVSALPDGNFIVVWSGNGGGGDGQGSGIKTSVINGTTGAVIDTIVVNQETTGEQTMPSVVMTDTGDIIVAWTDRNGSGGDNSVAAIKGQVLAWDGTHVTQNGGEFLVNQSVDGEQRVSALTAVAGGGFAVSWTDYGAGSNLGASGIGDTGTGDIKMRIYANSGVNEAPVISSSGGNQTGTITVAYGQTSVFDFNATDNNPGDTQFWSIIGTDAHLFNIDSATGVLSFIDPAQVGSFNVTVLVEDSGLLENSQDITVNVLNTPPDAVNDNYIAFAGQTLIINTLFDNDIDAEDGLLTYANFDAITATTQNGTLVNNQDGTFSYTANAGFTGEDAFSYRVVDANGEPDIATVSIHVETPPENVLDFSATGIVADFDGDPDTPDTHAVSVRVNLLDYGSENGGYVQSYVPSTGEFVGFYVSDFNSSPSTIARVIGTANNDQFANSSPNPERTVIFEGGSGDDTYNANAAFGGNSFDGGSGSNKYVLVADLGGPVNVTVDFAIVDANGFSAVNLDSGALGSVGDKVKNVQQIFTSNRGGNDSIDASTLSSNFYAFVASGTDTVTTGSGNDEVVVGMGVKTLDGGAGIDWVNFSPYTFYGSGLTGGLSINLDNGTSYYSSTPAAALQDQSILLNFENAYGSILDDTIIGTAGDNRLDGYDGNDSLIGGLGIDDLRGGLGNDRLTGGSGGDFLYGGNDFVVGNEMDTAVYAGAFSEYTTQADPFSSGRTLVSEITTGETDGLFAIEKLEFSDGTYDVLTGVFTSNLNTPPVLAGDLTASIDEGGGYALTLADLSFTDSEDNASEVTFTTSDLVNGFILVRGVDANSFTAQDIADGVVKFIHDGSETLTAGFSVTVEDGNEDNSQPPAPALFTFTVTPVNDAPVAPTLSITLDEDGFGILPTNGDATDVDSPSLTYTLKPGAGPAHGVIEFDPFANNYYYRPDANYNGPDTAIMVVSDGQVTAEQIVNFTVNSVNDAPVVSDYTLVLDEDSSVALDFSTISDVDSTEFTFEVKPGYGPAHGAIVNDEVRGFVYVPDANFNGTDSVTLLISDGSTVVEQVVTFTVTPVNDAPVAPTLSITLDEDGFGILPTNGDATDVDSPSLTYTLKPGAGPAHGVIEFDPFANNYYYRPDANYNGPDTAIMVVSDGQVTAEQIVNFTVNSVNDAPVVSDYTLVLDEDSSVALDFSTISDVDSTEFTFEVKPGYGPAHGAIVNDEVRGFVYVPDANFNGTDSVTLLISDGSTVVEQVVTFTVTPVNDAPVAPTLSITLDEDGFGILPTNGDATDVDSPSLTYTLKPGAGPAHGVIEFDPFANNYYYRPDANYNGPDTAIMVVSDGQVTAEQIVNFTVNSVNDAPVVSDYTLVLDEDSSVALDFSTISDVDSTEFTFEVKPGYGPAHGAIVNDEVRGFVYVPDANFNGTDSVTLLISDGSTVVEQVVTFTVTPVNDAPVAPTLSITLDEDGFGILPTNGDATDVDSPSLTYTLKPGAGPAHGVIEFDPFANNYYYRPDANYNGPDTAIMVVSDGQVTAEQIVNFTVNSVNDAPVVSDYTLVLDEDSSVALDFSTISDVDSTEFTFEVKPGYGPAHGAIVNDEVRGFVYVPDANFNGTDSVTLLISDGSTVVEQVVTFTVTPVNDAPVAPTLSITLDEDGFGILPTNGDATDVDSPSLTYTLKPGAGPAHGVIEFDPFANNYYYRPDANYNGPDTAIMVVSDGQVTTEQIVNFTVNSVNDAPTDILLSGSSIAENSTNGTAIGALSFSDPDIGESVVYSLVAGVGAADNGLVSIVGNQVRVNGAIDFEANPTLDLRVRATDSGGLFIEKSINVTVTDVVESPVLNVINGVPGQFSVPGTSGNDKIFVGPSNFVVNANGGNDTITLTPSANNLIHYFNGGAGNDTLDLSLMTNPVSVDLGSGVSQGRQAGIIFFASIENAIGGSGGDTLVGNSSANQLNGGLGNDSISGEGGSDTLIGGGGRDRFIFDDNDSGVGSGNRDLIIDFIQGIDTLDIRQIDANVSRGSDQAFSASISFWNGVGNEFAANSAGTIKYHYETILGVQHTIIDLNNDADRAVDIQVALVGTYTFNNTNDFIL